ncbi:hypothetical protein H2203_008408 [Taxawa tesnikishii (nom. ined.)]|nr:hypothetical protein H2203_008408 [Dothideales sp. JES 119]
MATADLASRPADRNSRRRPFTAWMKKLTNLKSSDTPNTKKSGAYNNLKGRKGNSIPLKNNPYPLSGPARRRASDTDSATGNLSFSTPASRPQDGSYASLANSTDAQEAPQHSNKSAAPTVATNPETIHSDAGFSKAFTSTTAGGALSSTDGAGANSTFSSPNQSQQSLTTTLTTIQSTSPGNALNQQASQGAPHHHANGHASANHTPVHFSHQYPVSPTPASAIPPHMAQTGNPTTYSSATAHNLLTDNASILTLASSSKRRRRRSMDTDASVRALAPSSVWGGSRESLPLSVLSANADHNVPQGGIYSSSQSRPSIGGLASAERASVYSSQGISAPALASERNSYYAASHKQLAKDRETGDGKSIHRDGADGRSLNFDGGSLRGYDGSIRSGAVGHGRNDSIPGSIGSPLASPMVSRGPTGGISRRSSDWQHDRDGENAKDRGVEGEREGTKEH